MLSAFMVILQYCELLMSSVLHLSTYGIQTPGLVFMKISNSNLNIIPIILGLNPKIEFELKLRLRCEFKLQLKYVAYS